MLSRLACRKALQLKHATPSLVGSLRLNATKSEGPERDLVNFPRPVRPEFPSKVRYCTVPEEWFDFFYKKTGVTGPYVFGAGVFTYLLSKEIWVIEHDFYGVFGFFGLVYLANRTIGKKLSGYLDREIDETESSFKSGRENQIKNFETAVQNEENAQWRADGQTLLIDAKRENVKMQLEASYRERAMQVYSEVKKRLDYQVEKQRIDQHISQKHMVQWVVSNVLKSISDQQEKENIKKCLVDLEALAAKA